MSNLLRSYLGLLLCLTALSAGCSSTDTPTLDSTSTTEVSSESTAEETDFSEAIAQETADAFFANEDGGAVVQLRTNGNSISLATGDANENADKLKVDSQFYVGSISKTFIATAVLQLVEEGTITLDEPLSTYLPDTKVGGSITIRQLLAHESGIKNYTDVPALFVDVLGERDKQFTPQDLLSYIEDEELQESPTFSYSNTNYILLGQLLEEVEGAGINTIIEKRITNPLGLSQTFFATQERPATDTVAGWSRLGPLEGDPDAPYTSVRSSAWTAGALVSSAEDLAIFLEALFGEELLSAERLSEMTTVGEEGNGFGIFRVELSATEEAFSHSGAIPGYTSSMSYNPGNDDYLIVLTNNDSRIADDLVDQLFEQW